MNPMIFIILLGTIMLGTSVEYFVFILCIVFILYEEKWSLKDSSSPLLISLPFLSSSLFSE